MGRQPRHGACWVTWPSHHGKGRPKDTTPSALLLLITVFCCSGTLPLLCAASVDVDNGVLGSPAVECGRDFVQFGVATKKPFGGRVYVKGEFENAKCVKIGRATGGGDGENGRNNGLGTSTEFGGRRGGKKGDEEEGKLEDVGRVPEGEQAEEEVDEETIRQILQELQKRRNNNLDGSQRPIPSHLPGFGSAEQLKRWRSFLKGKPGLDGQGFRRYGSRLSPDANGECPLICPPCDDCDGDKNQQRHRDNKRHRRLAGEHSAELRVPLGECKTRRDRMANPPGMQVSFTVVVSFHPNFITRVDRAYNIQCAYQEPERLLSTQIDVSPPPTIHISNQIETPQCAYLIHGQSSTDQVKNVRVGDMVEHRWSCHGSGNIQRDQQGEEAAEQRRMAEQFGLLVHDCFVDDGKSRRAQVVDGRGCSTDPQILPTPEYSSDSLRASILSPVAKFPDGDLVGFQCTITVCMRELGKCDGVTVSDQCDQRALISHPLPPDCSSSSVLTRRTPLTDGGQKGDDPDNARAMLYSSSIDNRTKRSVDVKNGGPLLDWQLNSPLMTVFDLVEGTEEVGTDGPLVDPTASAALGHLASSAPPVHLHLRPHQLCVSLPLFTVLVSISTFLTTVSVGTLIAVLFFRDSIVPSKH